MEDDAELVKRTLDFVFPFDDLLVMASPAAALKAMRQRAGLTQEQLASKLNTVQSGIAATESGNRIPTLATLAKVADATDHVVQIRLMPVDGIPSARITNTETN